MGKVDLNYLKKETETAKVLEKKESRITPESRESLRDLGEGKPSVYYSDLKAKLRRKKQLNIGQIPEFIYDMFMDTAASRNLSARDFIFELLRETGHELPPLEDLDLRKLNSKT